MKLYIPRHTFGDEPLHTHSLLHLTKRLTALGVDHSFAVPFYDSHINRGRNRCAANFLATDAEMMLSVDADITFKPWDVERLINSGYDFVGAPYPMKTPLGGQLVGNFLEPIEQDAEGFIEARDIGAGFCLLHRRVFEKLATAAPRAISDLANAEATEYGVFYDSGLDGQQYITEDWWLSRAYRALGGRCWLDGEARLGHVGKHVYTAPSATELLSTKGGQ